MEDIITPFNPVKKIKSVRQRKVRSRFDDQSDTFNIYEHNLMKALGKYGDIPTESRRDFVKEMSGLNNFSSMNATILAAAVAFYFVAKRKDQLTLDMWKRWSEQVIEPIEPDLRIEKVTRDLLLERLRADVLRYCRIVLDYRQELLNF
jgi:hypothetical protein